MSRAFQNKARNIRETLHDTGAEAEARLGFCFFFFLSLVASLRVLTPVCPGSLKKKKKPDCNRRQQKGAAVSAFLQRTSARSLAG